MVLVSTEVMIAWYVSVQRYRSSSDAVWLQRTSLSLCTVDTKTNQLNLHIITKMTKHVTQSRVKI